MPEQPGGHPAGERLVLRTAIGQYPHTAALRDGAVASDLVAFDFVDVPTIHQAFAPMVREQRFDVSEMAIATFLQAKAYGKPLVLLPVVLSARFQQSALLCRADSDIGGPCDLIGRRVGVRARPGRRNAAAEKTLPLDSGRSMALGPWLDPSAPAPSETSFSCPVTARSPRSP